LVLTSQRPAARRVAGHLARVAPAAVAPGRREDPQSPGAAPQAFPDLPADDHGVPYDPRVPADVRGHVNLPSGHEQVAADADLLRNIDFPSRDDRVDADRADDGNGLSCPADGSPDD